MVDICDIGVKTFAVCAHVMLVDYHSKEYYADYYGILTDIVVDICDIGVKTFAVCAHVMLVDRLSLQGVR